MVAYQMSCLYIYGGRDWRPPIWNACGVSATSAWWSGHSMMQWEVTEIQTNGLSAVGRMKLPGWDSWDFPTRWRETLINAARCCGRWHYYVQSLSTSLWFFWVFLLLIYFIYCFLSLFSKQKQGSLVLLCRPNWAQVIPSFHFFLFRSPHR